MNPKNLYVERKKSICLAERNIPSERYRGSSKLRSKENRKEQHKADAVFHAIIIWKGSCQFLELQRTPLCCAVSANHRLAKATEINVDDLNGEVLIMPLKGVSNDIDAFRRQVTDNYPSVRIIDSEYYGVDTFALCEMNSYIL